MNKILTCSICEDPVRNTKQNVIAYCKCNQLATQLRQEKIHYQGWCKEHENDLDCLTKEAIEYLKKCKKQSKGNLPPTKI